jgi:hypothetical protein
VDGVRWGSTRNLKELRCSLGGLAGGDLEEVGDEFLLRVRRGVAGHGGGVGSTRSPRWEEGRVSGKRGR